MSRTVAILTPDVSQNGLGRADVLARVLAQRFDVSIVGPQFGPGVWAPLAGEEAAVPVTGVPMPRHGRRQQSEGWRRIRSHLDADLVYVSKPFASSMWNAWRACRGRPMALDIDDWEAGLLSEARQGLPASARAREFWTSVTNLHHRADWNVLAGDRLARRIRLRTAASRFLQRRFGGTLVWHARDTEVFDPSRFSPADERQRLGLPDSKTIVMFLGTPHLHKGMQDLVDLVRRVPSCHLVVAGADPLKMPPQLGSILRDGACTVLPPARFSHAPRLLSACDVVVLPQKGGPATSGQVPAKVFDALAMGKPVIASATADLPEILAGCGRVVPPGDAAGFATALEEIASDPDLRRRLGATGRSRCVAEYSVAAMRRVLPPLLEEAL